MKLNFIMISVFFVFSCNTNNREHSAYEDQPLVQSTKFEKVRVVNINIPHKTQENLNKLTLLLTDYRITTRNTEEDISLFFTFDESNKYFLFVNDVTYVQQALRTQYTYIPLSSIKLKNIDVFKANDGNQYTLLIESDYKKPTFIYRDLGPSRKFETSIGQLYLRFKSSEEALEVKQYLIAVIDAIK